MSAEGMPQEGNSLFARFLARATGWILRRPVGALLAAALLTVVSVTYAAGWLGFRTSRLDLLNPDSPFNKLWIDYIEEFGDQDDAVVVIEGPSPETVAPVKRELAELLARESASFHAVLHEVDLAPIRAKGLHFLPLEQLQQIDGFVAQAEPVVQGDWTLLNFTKRVRRLNQGVRQMQAGQAAATTATDGDQPADANLQGLDALVFEVEQLASHLTAALTGAPAAATLVGSPLQEMEQSLATLSQTDSDFLRTRDGWMGFVLLRLAPHQAAAGGGHPAISRLREVLAQTQARHPATRIGLTGMPILEDDEMRSSQQDMTFASLVSLVGVGVLFVVGFGGWRHPMLCIVALLVGMAWSVGYITLAVGHLNLLSVAFGVILIGLGIDFGIHYVARYLHLRRELERSPRLASQPADDGAGSAVEHALIRTSCGVGPAVICGAVTTSLAFYAAGLTQFTGVAELGVIAGGGILLCCAAVLGVLPALIAVTDQSQFQSRVARPLDLSILARPATARPRTILAVSLGATAALMWGAPSLWYDHNLLHLQADDLESVRLEKKLLQETDKSVWFAISIADSPDELRRRKALFQQLPMVDRTEEIASLLPSDDDTKATLIARVAQRLRDLPERPPWIDVDPPEQLGIELAQLQQVMAAMGRSTGGLAGRLENLRGVLRGLTPRQYYERLSPYQQSLAGEMLTRLHLLRSVANPEPPQLADLPESLVARFVGKNNRHLLKVYGRGDIWNIESLEQFVRQVKSVDPRATGHPLQTYYASKQMQQSYLHAAIYALLAVAIVLMLDFRSVRHSLLALVPVGLGMTQMFGIMGLCDLPLNPANMIVLPLLLGIGVDSGVHIVHDFRTQRGRYRVSASTVTAVTISSLTTMLGFGSMLLASHQGIRSLGLTLTVGVACCLVSSLGILPPLLILLRGDGLADEPKVSSQPLSDLSPLDNAPAPLTLRRRGA